MAAKIFFCGEVVADLHEKVAGSGDFKFMFGGSQFLGSIGAARARQRANGDWQIGFVGPLSEDTFGERFYQALLAAGVDTSGIRRVTRNTTLAIVSIRPGKENAFTFYGRDTAEQMTKIEELPEMLGRDDEDKICCFGSISTVMEPARFAWLEFARRQRDRALLCYDLNTRPTIAKDPERYRGIVREWARTAHVVKASDADIAWAYPGMAMPDIAKIWLAEGASMAVFTKGMNGSEAYTRKASATAPAQSLTAANTVGAGDNFNAGLAVGLCQQGCFSAAKVEALDNAALAAILRGANDTAASHLVSIGAKTANAAS